MRSGPLVPVLASGFFLCRIFSPAPAAAGGLTGSSLISFPLSVRQAGMGGVSLGGNGVMRGWSNPALIAEQGSKYEMEITGSRVSGESNFAGLGWGQAFNPSWTGGAFASTNALSVRGLDMAVGHRTVLGGMALAWKGESFRLGIAGKGVSESVSGVESSAVLGQAGLAMRAGYWTVGTAVQGTGGQSPDPGPSASLPVEVRLGASRDFSRLGIVLAGECIKPLVPGGSALLKAGETSPVWGGSVSAGIEWRPIRLLALRAGGVKGLEKGAPAPDLTGGLSAWFRGFALDYALDTRGAGINSRVSLGCRFGGQRDQVGADRMGIPLVAPLRPGIPISSTMSIGPGIPVENTGTRSPMELPDKRVFDLKPGR